MKTETDVFGFGKLKALENIKDNLPDNAREIVDIYEDLFFIWNFKDSNLRVFNWRLAQNKNEKDVKFQTLIPSSTPNFTVTKISVSYGGSYVAITGPQGLSIIELPARFGSNGIFHGKSQITCKIINIHEHAGDQLLEVIQIRWHPNSPSDSHLVALFSDNSLRMYDEDNLKHTWRVGPLPSQSKAAKNFSYIKSLGDTAIDFDIAPAQVNNSELSPNNTLFIDTSTSFSNSSKRPQEQKKVEWPFIILRGNGSIFILTAGFSTEKPRLQGPLTMIPSQKDNYGDDSCSLLVIPTLPITIVIAENTGTLHHALLIESNPESSFDDTKTILHNDWDLYVLENIELELGFEEEKVKDAAFSPLYLKRDPINEQRYFCYHDAGLHGVTIGFIQQLQNFVGDNEEQFNPNVPSRVEYILSTKAFNNSKENAVIGFGILQLPLGIFVILSSGQVVSLNTIKTMIPLPSHFNAQAPSIEQKVIDQELKIPFDQHIKILLKSDVSQPILQLDKTTPPTSKQSFQLLMNSIQIMRDKQFVRHDKVRLEIIKRAKILELMKIQQKDEIVALLKNKEDIQEKAYKLADNHEEIIERQHELQKRINDVSRLVLMKIPSSGANEKEFRDNLKRLKMIVEKLNQDVKQIKAKYENQNNSLEKWRSSDKNGSVVSSALPPKQEETIKEFVTDMMRQIQELKVDVQKIHNVVDY